MKGQASAEGTNANQWNNKSTSETSLGVVTIRAFNMADDKFFENYLKLTDTDAKLFFYSNATLEWSILRVETLQNITLFTAVFLLALIPKGYVAPGTHDPLKLRVY
ncbi:ABC transporter C family member 8 [Camellia lanceoleosa]|uniref:ABC transporter C family member 8 n=1 Tax=Camellia lanceoleosa TaxID=1840588 RepID=A0ACC0FBD7_9ERIC|nr:ABC transporter C family member 8 [Camellia lanceoleosa]